jgi:hypothetical protein
MSEQATNAEQISAAAENLRLQSTQSARALQEQSAGIKSLSTGSTNVSKQIRLITVANLEHSASAAAILDKIRNLKQLAERNLAPANGKAGDTPSSSELSRESVPRVPARRTGRRKRTDSI